MSNDWALVIGINDYPKIKNGTLPYCVDDALSFTRWLLDPAGGGLAPKRVYLLLNPVPKDLGLPVAAANVISGCDHETFVRTTQHLVSSSGGKGDRLFFYFSGHGFTFREGTESYREALAFEDFSHSLSERSVSAESLIEYFNAVTQISNHFYFFDCCREVLELDPDRKKRTIAKAGRLSYVDEELLDRKPVQYFSFYATQPGLPAAQLLSGDRPGSHFTNTLVDGLKGAECAKVWDPQTERYLVRQSRLFKYLLDKSENSFTTLPGGIRQVPQMRPQIGSPGLDPDPVLASYSFDTMPKESWEISVDPALVFSNVKFRYRGGWEPVDVKKLPKSPPLCLNVPPHNYILHGDASGYEPAPESGWKKLSGGWLAEVYRPTSTRIGFQPTAKAAAEPAPTGKAALSLGGP